jgi:hypothetical protein
MRDSSTMITYQGLISFFEYSSLEIKGPPPLPPPQWRRGFEKVGKDSEAR